MSDDIPLKDMIACPGCDLLYRVPELTDSSFIQCQRCHTRILSRDDRAINRALVAVVTAMILYLIAIFNPFLELSKAGVGNRISVFDAVLTLWQEQMPLLSVLAFLTIMVMPMLRFFSLAVVLSMLQFSEQLPLWIGRVFRWSNRMVPWAMAEVFMIGVVVSLVKIGGLADLRPDPAFWAFIVLVVVMTFKQDQLYRDDLWLAIEARRDSEIED